MKKEILEFVHKTNAYLLEEIVSRLSNLPLDRYDVTNIDLI